MAAPTEVQYLGDSRPKRVERSVKYAGERRSMLSFFFQFKGIICRAHGSVFPFIMIELIITLLLSFAAQYLTPDEQIQATGHSLAGTLLAFLVVFRTQMAWGQYTEGRAHVGALIAHSRSLSVEVLGSLVSQCRADGEAELPGEAAEIIRLLKLHFYIVVEHIRSSDGHLAWDYAQGIAHSFATPHEIQQFHAEFGRAQQGLGRRLVRPLFVRPAA